MYYKSLSKKIFYLFLVISFVGTLFIPMGSKAAVVGYTTEITKKTYNSTINLTPGKGITFEVELKNTGTKTWSNSSKNYISFYADGAGMPFYHNFWLNKEQPGKLIESSVAPGELGHLKFALEAPEVLGLYTAKFKLAAEDLTWIPGGVLEVPINVTNNPESEKASSGGEETVAAAAKNFGATKLIQSHSNVNLAAGEKITFRVGFKNTGEESWTNTGSNNVKICINSDTSTDPYRDNGWQENNCPTSVSTTTLPGQLGFFNFNLLGAVKGEYNVDFILMNQDKIISGGIIPLSIIVSSSGTVATLIEEPEEVIQLSDGPTIRIGIFSTTEPVIIKANKNFAIHDSNNVPLFEVAKNDTVSATFSFTSKTYSVIANGVEKNNLSYLKFIPKEGDTLEDDTIFEVVNYENRPKWNTSLNDNTFRGSLELRYSEDRNKLYLINELKLEEYMRGIAEASNYLPQEFLKALMIAARTYAQYNLNVGGKHPAAYFTLNASAYDQVYRGHGSEIRLPNVMEAVEETRGVMVTYNDDIVVTPYFSQSDGRTRAWEEVWWGSGKPWLISKPDPYCAGRKMWGHGVGFSAYGGRKMAEAGKNFEEILKYYYTEIELKKIY